jgi:hypothetical protein
VLRDEEATPDKLPFSASWRCSGFGKVTVSWDNAFDGEKVMISFLDTAGNPFSGSGRGPAGSKTFNLAGVGAQLMPARVSTESGESATLPGGLNC